MNCLRALRTVHNASSIVVRPAVRSYSYPSEYPFSKRFPNLGSMSSFFGAASSESQDCIIPSLSLYRILDGIGLATRTTDAGVKRVHDWISSRAVLLDDRNFDPNSQRNEFVHVESENLSFQDWRAAIEKDLHSQEDTTRLANLTVAIAFLRKHSYQEEGTNLTQTYLDDTWQLIYGSINGSANARPLLTVSRSAQGFLAIPLCSLLKDGQIDELFRLHVWLPDGQRGNPDLNIHSHQPYGQSWVLAGAGGDNSYNVEPVDDPQTATHAEYALSWSDGKSLDTKYQTHQSHSVISNTNKYVRATRIGGEVHTRGMSYAIPSATFHSTNVLPQNFHATLFHFNSNRGFEQDARVLGPKDGNSYTQIRDPAGMSASTLGNMVDVVRKFEIHYSEGHQHAQRAELEPAMRSFSRALQYCESDKTFPNAKFYRHLVLGELGNINRRFGRYEQARQILEKALADMGLSSKRADMSGELGVVYRHMTRFAEAKRAFEDQYNTAKELNLEHGICRALGNLGMVNYQLSQQDGDRALLEVGIKQLHEGVETARQIKHEIDDRAASPNKRSAGYQYAITREVIGLARLSLAYAAHGDMILAISNALESLNLARSLEDSNVIALSRFFYGRALLANGERDMAMQQFNPPEPRTPAMALCNEPSDEHNAYLQELVDAGADLDRVDEQGYTALDLAVFGGDKSAEEIVIEGLRRSLTGNVSAELAQRENEARIRKAYREVFQDRLRGVLLRNLDKNEIMWDLRNTYMDTLVTDERSREMFDGLKYITYSDFLDFGKLPRSSDGLAREYSPRSSKEEQQAESCFVIFFSYRRQNKNSRTSSPDDANDSVYNRMILATEEFLGMHPTIKRENLKLWIDHACVNQDAPGPGVSALPIVVAQCDAVISLVDDEYYDRAWCSVEVMIVQTLLKSYGLHLWYEHAKREPNPSTQNRVERSEAEKKGGQEIELEDSGKADGASGWILRKGPLDLKFDMAEKQLTFEEDRARVLFLERQSKMLG